MVIPGFAVVGFDVRFLGENSYIVPRYRVKAGRRVIGESQWRPDETVRARARPAPPIRFNRPALDKRPEFGWNPLNWMGDV